MNDRSLELLEVQLRNAARHIPYPITPDLLWNAREGVTMRPAAQSLSMRVLKATLILMLTISSLTLLIPGVRATVMEVIRVGVVRIFLGGATATPYISSGILSDFAGEITLGEAQERVDFPIRLPSYPLDLGAPQAIYVQDEFGPIVIAVWSETHNPDQVKMSLHLLGTDAALAKSQPELIRRAQVNGIPAVWTQGLYMIIVENGEAELRRLVEGHVLIWKEGEITYPLESSLSLDEAITIAESLR